MTISEGERLPPHSVFLSSVRPVQIIQNLTFSDLEDPVKPVMNLGRGPVTGFEVLLEGGAYPEVLLEEGVYPEVVLEGVLVEDEGMVVGSVLFVSPIQPTLSTVGRSHNKDPQFVLPEP